MEWWILRVMDHMLILTNYKVLCVKQAWRGCVNIGDDHFAIKWVTKFFFLYIFHIHILDISSFYFREKHVCFMNQLNMDSIQLDPGCNGCTFSFYKMKLGA